MAGERILLVDSSAAVQDMARAILEEHGFKVSCSSNGLAALSTPDLEKYDVVLVDESMDGIDGLETSAQIRTDSETYNIPVILMVPEEHVEERGSQPLRGASGFVAKPFSPQQLLIKVEETLEERRLRDLSRQYLEESADKHMQTLAEQKIQQAVERKIQIIVERAIQSIVSIIDQRARREVDARVTALTAEKEKQLVKMTVQEVAHSMVEKLAERKVTEAMESILVQTTEKTVKRAADSMLPSMIRDRLKETLENMLPREIQGRVERATNEKMQELSEALVQVMQTEAKKAVPLIAKEKLPELAERQLALASEKTIPQLVASEARGAVANELNMRIKPMIESEINKIQKRAMIWMLINAVVLVLLVIFVVLSAVGLIPNLYAPAGG